jgi:DNA-binding transcriptional regulator LsrR (DeoR family)
MIPMKDIDHYNLLYKVSRAYYEDGLTQQEIGQRFGLSRIKISRLLEEARQQKIVNISIIPPSNEHVELERKIEKQYGLDEVLIAQPVDDSPNAILTAIGSTAAKCLMRTLRGEEVVAMTWGRTLLAMINALQSATGAPIRDWHRMRIVQALGGLGNPEDDIYSVALVHRLARTFGAKAHSLSAPGIVSSPEVREAIISDMQISSTLKLAARADIALLGLGQPTAQSVVMQSNTLSEVEFSQLSAMGMIGDIGLRYFDSNGCLVEHEINQRILGLTLEQIKSIPRVIVMAGGPEKFDGISAALRGGLISVLITDIGIARRLIKEG